MSIIIFTDGSSTVFKDHKKLKYGGIGIYSPTKNLSFSKSYKGEEVTNQRMELSAVIEAFKNCLDLNDSNKRIIIYTDSEYIIKSMTIWIKNWIRAGWKRNDKGKLVDISNIDLIKELYNFTKIYNTKFIHVRSHQDAPRDKTSPEYLIWFGNDLVDQLASKAMHKIRSKNK